MFTTQINPNLSKKNHILMIHFLFFKLFIQLLLLDYTIRIILYIFL